MTMPSPAASQVEPAGEASAESDARASATQNINRTDTDASHSTIAESKEKARAVVAASATPKVEPAEEGAQDAGDQPTGTERANGSDGPVTGRKRSRSGSRRPIDTKERPARTKESYEAIQLEQYVYRQLAHDSAIVASANRWPNTLLVPEERVRWFKSWYDTMREYDSRRVAVDPGLMYGSGYEIYDYAHPEGRYPGGVRWPSGIRYPAEHSRRSIQMVNALRQSKKDRKDQAQQKEELVPIRLDIEWDKIRLRDTFTWNINDRHVNPKLFAERLVQDFGLPRNQSEPLIRNVIEVIQEQLLEYHPHAIFSDDIETEDTPYTAFRDDELRILIKLNITIGPNTLIDQFEWDLNNPDTAPEDFARNMTWELSLSGEFTTAIAHSIREQCQLFTRSLYVVGHTFDGRPIEDHEVAGSFQPSPLPTIFRPHQAAKEYTPYLYDLNEADIEKTELSVSREERAQKRSVNRRGGPTLPDLKNRPKTLRTLVVSSILPGSVETIDESRLYKRVQTVPKPKRGRNDDSDDDESDDSLSESVQPNQGTARTRGLRGATSVAQVAMRNAAGRSVTPAGYRESSSPEPNSLIVKLKFSKAMWQQFERAQRSKNRVQRPGSSQSPAKPSGSSMGPPTGTPRPQASDLPGASGSPAPKGNEGGTSKASGAHLGRELAAGHPNDGHPVVSSPVSSTSSPRYKRRRMSMRR